MERRLIEIPADGIIREPIITANGDIVGGRNIDLSDYPTVDAVPVVHGHWNWCENGEIRCSKCLGLTGVAYTKDNFKECIESLNYCSECGVKMDEVSE